MNPKVAAQSADQLSTYIGQGNLAGGMPSFADLSSAVRYVRRLNSNTILPPETAFDPSHNHRSIAVTAQRLQSIPSVQLATNEDASHFSVARALVLIQRFFRSCCQAFRELR
jgi:hypothetical protein